MSKEKVDAVGELERKLTEVKPTTPLPNPYYKVEVRCQNCGFTDSQFQVKKRTHITEVLCPNCECPSLLSIIGRPMGLGGGLR